VDTILITGGSGLIGSRLAGKLRDRGYHVSILSRSKRNSGAITTYVWDPDEKYIDPVAIGKADHIIHLAGENLTNKRWTKKYKKKIIDSRVKTTDLLFEKIKEHGQPLKSFVSASAVGYYGAVTLEKAFKETDLPGSDFVARTCVLWEAAADQFKSLGVRTVKIRTSPVLAKGEGVLDQLIIPVKLGIASPIGSGKQYFPWIHVDDLCEIYIKAIEDPLMKDAYNASSPAQTTNEEFMRTLATVLKKPFFFPNVPAFLMKLVFGEKGAVALEGSPISSEKIRQAGFTFKFPELKEALKAVFS
jgi:uncharacterized protein (TIGR01777 family)